jgi:predicted nuclease of restriction endonuclease-like (RecB) superfamily
VPSDYLEFLQDLKTRIRAAQVRAALAVNRELILLYWSIGRDLSQRFAAEEWGGKIIDRLAQDLQTEFPGIEGFSPRNLRYMRSLAEAWPEESILQQLVAKLPWSHNVRILDRIADQHLVLHVLGAPTPGRDRSPFSSRMPSPYTFCTKNSAPTKKREESLCRLLPVLWLFCDSCRGPASTAYPE